jgi:hypothetical protein
LVAPGHCCATRTEEVEGVGWFALTDYLGSGEKSDRPEVSDKNLSFLRPEWLQQRETIHLGQLV